MGSYNRKNGALTNFPMKAKAQGKNRNMKNLRVIIAANRKLKVRGKSDRRSARDILRSNEKLSLCKCFEIMDQLLEELNISF